MSEFDFKGKNNPKISALDSDYSIKFYLKKKDLSDYEYFTKFVNAVKSAVRKDPRYNNYKSELYGIGLDRCQHFSDITKDMADLEMHHGPIFSLYDICAIITDHLAAVGEDITTFKIADIVLKEHEKHNIQLVMLCETAHEAAENGSIFLSFKQGFGHIDKFITKYHKGLKIEHLNLLKKYVQLSEENDATDNDVFKLIKRVKKYVKK